MNTKTGIKHYLLNLTIQGTAEDLPEGFLSVFSGVS